MNGHYGNDCDVYWNCDENDHYYENENEKLNGILNVNSGT